MSDLKTEKKKFNGLEFLAVTLLVLTISVIAIAGTWWFMQAQVNENQDAANQTQANLLNRISQYQAKIKIFELTGAASSTYTGAGYSMTYPKQWVYRVYNGSSNNLVAFAATENNLPAANSDRPAVISISSAKSAAQVKDLTSDPTKSTKETVTIGSGISATKWTLAAGRSNDLGGSSKIVIYEVKLKDGTFLRIQNVSDQSQSVLNDMLSSLKLS